MPLFRHKPTVVEAYRLNENQELEIRVKDEDAFIPARGGSWVITDLHDDETWRILHQRFIRLYSPDDDIARAYLERVRR